MEFNSYKYYQYEVAIARLIQLMIDRAQELEQFKLSYVGHMKFDSYEVFLTIDEDKQRFISNPEIMKFLRRNNVSVKQKEVEFLIDRYSSLKSFLFFKDFLRLILPQGDEDMIDTVVKQSLGVVKDSSQRISPLIEHKISELIEKEIKMVRELEDLKIAIAEKYFWSHRLSVEVLMKGRQEHVTPEILEQFMKINGDGRYKYEDFKFLKFRYSKNESIQSLTQQEFADMVYPYEFFVDPNDEKYDNFKSQQKEIEDEKFLIKKIQEKEEFDNKFKIIGDFIKDPEYYEKPQNIIEFFETNRWKDLYKNLKDFDYYIDFAKEKIVFKKEEEEEKKEVLDFYETIKKHQQDIKKSAGKNTKRKNKRSKTIAQTSQYQGLGGKEDEGEDLFDTSNMPMLKDYLRQLKYETPSQPMSIKQFVKLIRADRNIFYYEKPEIKILKRMDMFTTIRSDMKKQELRQNVLDNKIEDIKVKDDHIQQLEKRKLFSAFSQYNMIEDIDTSSPKQTSPYKTFLYKSLHQKNSSFGEVLSNQKSPQKSDQKLIKPQFIQLKQQQIDDSNDNSPNQNGSNLPIKEKINLQEFIKQKIIDKSPISQNSKQSKGYSNPKSPISQIQKSSISQIQKSPISQPQKTPNSQISRDQRNQKQSNIPQNIQKKFQFIPSNVTDVKKLHFNENGEAYSSQPISLQSLDHLDQIQAVIPDKENKQISAIQDYPKQQKQPKQLQQESQPIKPIQKKKINHLSQEEITKQAHREVLRFKLLNAVRRQEMMRQIVDKTNFGDYKNIKIYQKYYQ